jgi:tetratricopeptide (TPR) repeat protein
MALDTNEAEGRLKEALGECRNKNFEKGRDLLESLIADDPENYAACDALGKVLVIMKEPDGAIEKFKQAIEIRPDFAKAILNLAQTFYKMVNCPDARNYYQRIVEYEPKNADGHFGLGNVYRKQEKYKEAARCYNDALEINPKDAQAYINLGLCHYKADNYHDAVYNYMMALELGGDNPKAFMNLALSLEKTDRYSEACQYWERYIDMAPKDEYLDMAIEHLSICKTKS